MPLSPLDLSLNTFRDLTGNWVRSGLTTLGIFMGVTAINATLNIDAITSRVLQERLESRDNPYVSPWIYGRDKPPVEWSDEVIADLQQSVPGIVSISRVNWLRASQVQYLGNATSEFDSSAVSENYQRTTGRQILQGRFFEPADFAEYRPVVVIDEVLEEQLFEGANPIGEGIFIDQTRFTVVGVTESKKVWEEEELSGTLWVTESYGDVIQGPFRYGRRIQIAIADLENYETIQDQIQTYLEQNFPGYSVNVWGNVGDIYEEEQQLEASVQVLKVVGIMALVIGGVGIANITIAAIMERTREIGLRRAIGATDLEVMAQFIAEAALLSLLGGATAVVAVHFLTKTATTTLFEAPYEFSPRDAAISMGAAFAVGVGSSFLPALRVTQIDIIQALRGD
jgi:putative ABC transport system permease protein